MLSICKASWKPGVLIDDLFYELKDHNLRNCKSGKVLVIGNEWKKESNEVREAGVLIPVKVNGKEVTAMLDSGAQPSVIDQLSLKDT